MLITLFRLCSRFPLPVLYALGGALGWIVYLLSPSYRRRMRENMARAGVAERLGRAIGEAGRNVAELPFIWCAPPRKVLATVTIDDWGVVQEVLDAGRGVIFLTPHLGCFEVTAQAIATRTPITALYRPPRKEALRPLIEGARARENLMLAPANLSGVRTLLKVLKNNGAIGLLPDQVPQQGEGVWAPFFGRPAYTMTLPAKLHQMTGAPIILTWAERLPGGRGYAIRFARFDETLEGTPEQQAAAINRAMERLIAKCPEQYFWSYNRYKVPAGAEPPPADSGAGR